VNLVTPPTRPDCDAGLIIMESTDYPPMSGSNTICTVTVLLETGMLPMREPVTRLTLDTPAGPVPVEARCRDGKVERVQFTNVACFATHLGATLEVEGLGPIAVDVAYGGAFFAIVDAPALGLAVEPKAARDLVQLGNRITAAAARQLPVRHPENPDLHTVTFTEFAMPFAGPGTTSRNAVIVAPGRIDRSPCGTGTCARLAVLHARGHIKAGQGFVHESIIGSRFEAGIASEVTVGGTAGIVPTIAGQAWITGVFQHGFDPSDPFRGGFTLPDLWHG
jgi:proline racemase